MKLHKALKLRKKLTGDISRLKAQIQTKNSYLAGSVNAEKYNVPKLYSELLKKVDELVGLKFAINEANREIQSKIYVLSENKALIAFWNETSVQEGTQLIGYSNQLAQEYKVQIDEEKRNEMIKELQTKVDSLQEEIDTFNYTTDIPWDEPIVVKKSEPVKTASEKSNNTTTS
jgi:uncharacterized coiled-coil DUF342 family protein